MNSLAKNRQTTSAKNYNQESQSTPRNQFLDVNRLQDEQERYVQPNQITSSCGYFPTSDLSNQDSQVPAKQNSQSEHPIETVGPRRGPRFLPLMAEVRQNTRSKKQN